MMRPDRKNAWYLIVVVLLGVLTMWGCPKKTEVTSTPEAIPETAPSVQQAPAAEPARPEPSPEAEAPQEKAVPALQPVYFDFDKSFIRSDARDILKANADWLKANPKVKIKIEGNCDDRGTIEYNQALGQRRAASAKKYLTDLGISPSRISIISYGKEKPVCTESTESCWQKNRRDDFTEAR
jgi:peptidoglycan-associated lipoprotein